LVEGRQQAVFLVCWVEERSHHASGHG
jgi:hypothetical protein